MDITSADSRLTVVRECLKQLGHLPFPPVKRLQLEVLLLNKAIALLSAPSSPEVTPTSYLGTSGDEILLMMKNPKASAVFYQDLVEALNHFGKAYPSN